MSESSDRPQDWGMRKGLRLSKLRTVEGIPSRAETQTPRTDAAWLVLLSCRGAVELVLGIANTKPSKTKQLDSGNQWPLP